MHTGTSPTNCLFIASTNKLLACSIDSSTVSFNSSALTLKYSQTLTFPFVINVQFAGAISFIPLYTALPGATDGPKAKSSVNPSLSTSAFTSGCANIVFISEPKIISLPLIE